VNVTVTNADTGSGTLTNGYTYVLTQFDPNGDHVIDPSDVFYLVNYLFLSGPQPIGDAGYLSGDANDDGTVDPSDIFAAINYLYTHGPAPASMPPRYEAKGQEQAITGSIELGEPVRRGNRVFVPVVVKATGAEAVSLRVTFPDGRAHDATIHRAGAAQPVFEISRSAEGALAYLVSYAKNVSGTIAEIEIEAPPGARVAIEVDPVMTLLSSADGSRRATVAGGTLRVSGAVVEETIRRKEIR
jgi:hypothetical protein